MNKNNPAKIIYHRDLKDELKQYLERKEIIAIRGPRQAGKTTLLKSIYQDMSTQQKSIFLTFEKKDSLDLFEKDIESFKKIYAQNYQFVFIDEFQYAKRGGKNLKYLFDTADNCKFIISGSSSLELKGQTAKYLVGRIFFFDLFPFSFSEFLNAKDKNILEIISPFSSGLSSFLKGKSKTIIIKNPLKNSPLIGNLQKYLEEYLIFGGYPAVITAKSNEEKKVILKNILDTYLLRDIKGLLSLATDEELITIAKFLSLQIGNLVVYQEIGNLSNLSYQSLKKHLKILKETFIIDLLLPYFRNKRTELTKNPKVYFFDTGFRNMLIDNFTNLSKRTDLGALFENFIHRELKGKLFPLGKINFWRTKSDAEVDFIVEREGEIIPIEAKFFLKDTSKIGKSFYSFVHKYNPKVGLIFTSNLWGEKRVENCRIFFLPCFLL